MLLLLASAFLLGTAWGQDIQACVDEYKAKLDEVYEMEEKFITAKWECILDQCKDTFPEALNGCWTEDDLKKMGEWLEEKAQAFKDIIGKTGDYLVENCQAPGASEVAKSLKQVKVYMKKNPDPKPLKCMNTLMFHLIPPAAKECMSSCLMEKMEWPVDGLRAKLEWMLNPGNEPPEFIKKHDLKRAAMCAFKSCEMKTVMDAMMMEGGIVDFVKNLVKEMEEPEIQSKKKEECQCVKDAAKGAGVDLVVGQGSRRVDIDADWNCEEPFELLVNVAKCKNLKIAKLEKMVDLLE